MPGLTQPCPLRLPQTEVGKFIDMEDSVYNYKVDDLLNKRTEVEVKDDVPTYYHKSKRYARGKKGRIGRRTKASRGRGKAYRSRTKATKRRSSARKRKSTRRRRR